MRNFVRMAERVDVLPVVAAIAQHPDLWDEHTLRTRHPQTAHAQASDIWVWFNDVNPAAIEAVADDKDVIPYRAWSVIPQVRPIVFDLMRRVEAVRLGRVIITRLAPGKQITPHVDGGAPATYYSRFHVALQSLPGALFNAGGEAVNMKTGEVWWFDNQALHSVVNNSADDRIVMIVDLRT